MYHESCRDANAGAPSTSSAIALAGSPKAKRSVGDVLEAHVAREVAAEHRAERPQHRGAERVERSA